MGIGSGLDAQFGIVPEVTVGTPVVVNRFFEITSADLALDPTYLESAGIKPTKRFKRAAQVGISRRTTAGTIVMPLTTKNQGILWKPLIGSTAAAVLIAGSAYKQVHVPGTTFKGVSSTIQLGKPEPETGTVVPFTYNGCKVVEWSITIDEGAEVMLSMTIDGWDEVTTTALAAATYVAGNDTWNFADCSVFTIGGTASTTAGEVSIAAGASVASAVTNLTITGTNHFATERYGLGSAGIKREQIENDFCEITGSFTGDFNKAQLYDNFNTGVTVPIQADLVGPIISGADRYRASFIIPACKITAAAPTISGPDLVQIQGTFKGYDDETNAPLQVKLVSTDIAI